MSFLLAPLGVLAWMSDRMSRYSINGIPSNWGVILMSAFLFFLGRESWNDAHINGSAPRPMSVVAFANQADTNLQHVFVSVQGQIIPRARVSVSGGSSSYDLVALLDPHRAQGIWVKVGAGQYNGAKPFTARISGVMNSIDSDIHKHVQASDTRVGGVPMDTNGWLVAGNTPPQPFWAGFWTALGALSLLCFGGLSLARNIVFVPLGAPHIAPAPIPEDQPIPLRLSGKLRLHAKATGRFLNVPARTVRLDDGTFAFASLLDASKRLEGKTTESRAGVWLLVPGGEWTWRAGLLAHGGRRYPSVKIHYRDALDKNRRASAVLACEDEPTRAALLARLEREAIRAKAASGSAFQTI